MNEICGFAEDILTMHVKSNSIVPVYAFII